MFGTCFQLLTTDGARVPRADREVEDLDHHVSFGKRPEFASLFGTAR